MLKHPRVLLVAALLLALISFPLLALSPEQQLQSHLAAMQSLEAEFEQEIRDARGLRLQHTQGQVRLLKPGRFYWETRTPYPEILVSDGHTLWLYDPDLEQVRVQALDQRLAATPALILSGESADLAEHFLVSLRQQGDQTRFRLQPLSSDSLFEQLYLYFKAGQLQALRLEDSLGQETQVNLLNPAYNPPLDPQAFEFVIPEGVDVIRE